MSLRDRVPVPALAALLASGLALPASAQTGPFQDGELLVRGPVGSQGTLFRIDPQTGHGEILLDDVFPNYSAAGWVAYDSYRDMVLAYTAWVPLGTFFPRLYGIRSDGSVQNFGFDSEDLRSLTPVGDGRVYCNRMKELHLLDPGDNLVPVLDAGGQPVDIFLDHMVYHAPTNSLIGTTSTDQDSACTGINLVAIHRFPLNAAGTQLSGPSTCTSFNVGAAAYTVGLDPLGNGNYLATMTGVSPFSDNVFLEIDPATLAASVWSTSTLNDVNGGVWSQDLQLAVTLDDVSNELRTYTMGQGGAGTQLVVDVIIGDSTTGVSTANTFDDIEVLGAPCNGSATAFGTGLAGTGGFVPELSASLCPTLGWPLKVEVSEGLAGAVGLVAVSGVSVPFPFFGGTGYVVPPFVAEAGLLLSGGGGVGGAGAATVSFPTPMNPALLGVPIYFQAGFLDAGAVQGVSLTNALDVRLG